MIELHGVSKTFSATRAVTGVDLQVKPQATTALIGPSGCGKSTLLKLMLGLLEPDKGRVTFDGETITPSAAESMRRKMGYVIQHGGLFPHLTAAENVALLPGYLGWERRRITERTNELCELTHLAPESLSKYPVQLSGGQRQRVGLMRALMLDPRVILLDEPLGALDPMVRKSLQEQLRDIFAQLDKTVVIVTHDLIEAAYFAEVIVLMRRGKIVQIGDMTDLKDRPDDPFVTRFLEAQLDRPEVAR